VTAPSINGETIKGNVVQSLGDTLLLRQSKTIRPIPVPAITAIDVSRGKNRLLWGFLGATAGFFAGGFLGGNASDTGEGDINEILGVIAGVTVGTVGGAIIGAVAAPERWKRVFVR
jgi:hypothetical protein